MDSVAYCRQKTLASGSSFYYSFYLLPKKRRRAMFALYAFCREVDDIVDEIPDKNIAREKIAFWYEEINNLLTDKSSNPITKELLYAVNKFNLEPDDLTKIINGMVMDLEPMRYDAWNDLYLYCDHVAGVVGRLSASIFGFNLSNREGIMKYATSLGQALQLINILRDLQNDAVRERVYLPQELMQQINTFAGKNITEQSQILCERLCEEDYQTIKNAMALRINAAFGNASDNLPDDEINSQKSGIVMARIYRQVFSKIINSNQQARVSISFFEKITIILQTLIFKKKILD